MDTLSSVGCSLPTLAARPVSAIANDTLGSELSIEKMPALGMNSMNAIGKR
jgi:hypothetical protein